MDQLKVPIALILAVALQWTMRNVAEPLAYIDFPLIVVVYAALQRDAVKAIVFGAISGIAVDALSGGLLGANGFCKTLIAYAVSELARRVYLDNVLLRIFVIAGACLVDDLLYFWLHRLFGQQPSGSMILTVSYSLIGTTIAGTILYVILDYFGSPRQKNKRRDSYSAPRRQGRRRNPIRLGK